MLAGYNYFGHEPPAIHVQHLRAVLRASDSSSQSYRWAIVWHSTPTNLKLYASCRMVVRMRKSPYEIDHCELVSIMVGGKRRL